MNGAFVFAAAVFTRGRFERALRRLFAASFCGGGRIVCPPLPGYAIVTFEVAVVTISSVVLVISGVLLSVVFKRPGVGSSA
jgi:hypothetical protein